MQAEKLLRHIVLLQFKAETSKDQITEVGQAFLALPAQIAAIQRLEWGSAINEGASYAHCLQVICCNQAELKVYEDHPAHRQFQRLMVIWLRV
jgi:hypothetical protein